MTRADLLDLERPPSRASRVTPLRDAAVSAARRELIKQLAEVNLKVLNPTVITEAVCRAFVHADRASKVRSRRYSAHTIAMSKMSVGETIRLAGTSRATAHQRMKVARELMSNDAACWTFVTVGASVDVTRLEDGAGAVRRITAPVALAFASLAIGESCLMQSRRCHDGYYKAAARRALNVPNANWSIRQTSKGYRVTRIA